jgi:hypothetical protein
MKVFQNRVLRRICGPLRQKVRVHWRKLNNDEFNNFYCPLNIITVIKSKRMTCTGHEAHAESMRNAFHI